MARISLDPPNTLTNRLARWYSRRLFGAVIHPTLASGHNRKVLLADARFETAIAKWDALDPRLKTLAVMSSAQRIGCSWCIDFGHWLAHSDGISESVLREVPTWRTSSAFTPVERLVMEYAELASGEVADVTDELVTELTGELGEAAMVELAMMVAVENMRSRFNSGLGLTAQGFKDRCEVPA